MDRSNQPTSTEVATQSPYQSALKLSFWHVGIAETELFASLSLQTEMDTWEYTLLSRQPNPQ